MLWALTIERMFDIIIIPKKGVTMNDWIACVDLKGFYVQAYWRLQPSLEYGPLVVAGGNRVLEACPRARTEGISPGASLRQVRCLCPRADIIPFSPDECRPLYRQIWDIVAAHSPVVEPTDFHRGFADISRLVANACQARAWRDAVREQIQQQTDLQPYIGIGPGRFIARVAAAHNAVVAHQDLGVFLPLIPLSELDWLDSDLRDALHRLGLNTLGSVAEVDRNMLIQQVGATGGRLYDWINGKATQPVRAVYPPAEERVVHAFDMEDKQEVIRPALEALCTQLADRLRSISSRAGRLTLLLEGTLGQCTLTRQYSRPWQETSRLYRAAEQLLKQLWQGEPLLQMEIAGEELVPVEHGQLSLWNNQSRRRIIQAVAAAQSRYGIRAVSKASELDDERRFAQMVLAAEGRFSW